VIEPGKSEKLSNNSEDVPTGIDAREFEDEVPVVD